jgi:hypothetical protein
MCAVQIAPVVDASSSQSRADVLAIGLSAVLLLTGLQWLSLAPKPLTAVPLDAGFVDFFDESLPAASRSELAWYSLTTSCPSRISDPCAAVTHDPAQACSC